SRVTGPVLDKKLKVSYTVIPMEHAGQSSPIMAVGEEKLQDAVGDATVQNAPIRTVEQRSAERSSEASIAGKATAIPAGISVRTTFLLCVLSFLLALLLF